MKKIINDPVYNFKTFQEKPSEKELKKYYKEKYFKINPSYNSQMDPEEILFKKTQASFLLKVLTKKFKKSLSLIAEIGSGEGFFLKALQSEEINCVGYDYTKSTLHSENISCNDIFKESSDPIKEVFTSNKTISCLVLRHVIEHVRKPEELIKTISKNLKKNSILVIEAPHDFKPIQNYLLENKKIENEYWINYPDHLSYFEPENLKKLLSKFNFKSKECYSDFPIELFLLSNKLNYTKKKKLGKPLHLLRCTASNYLFDNTDLESLLNLYRAFANCKIGRSFTLIGQKI